MGNLRTIINAGRDACNVITVRRQECKEVPTRYQHPLDYLETSRKRKPEAGEQSTRRKKTPSSKK
jgi:hypothetical protein